MGRGEDRRVKKFNGKEKTPPLKNNPKKGKKGEEGGGGGLGGDKTKSKMEYLEL